MWKAFGIHINNKLIFELRVRSLCKKTSQQLNAFARTACSLKFDQRKLLLDTLIIPQFSYAPVVWMFHNQKLNNYINRIHERALRIGYQDHNPTLDELLAKVGSFKIHKRNLLKFIIEIFKSKMKLALNIKNEVFDITDALILEKNEMI